MKSLSLISMKKYLSKSISSLNKNKLNGMIAEIDFRNYLKSLGLKDRISPGGWIIRNVGPSAFGHNTIVLFPEFIQYDTDYQESDNFTEPPRSLHTICATMHQIGIKSYYCVPTIIKHDSPETIVWHSTQLGIPIKSPFLPLIDNIHNFLSRERNYNFLRYNTDTSLIPDKNIPEEFTKENLRVSFCSNYMSEISDIDAIFWGQQFNYPIEIKEKTSANDRKLGDYFGLDVGPFVKLAFYAAKKGNLHSIYIVREIDDVEKRNLLNWWFITFNVLAQFASWVPMGGGRNMQGGSSTVIKIPKSEFQVLNSKNLKIL